MVSGETLPMKIYHPGPPGEDCTVEESTYRPDAYDYHIMDLALDEAEKAGRGGDSPIGCAWVTPDGDVVSTETREFRDQHLKYHAEMRGYDIIQPIVGRDLSNSSLYTTSEPCYGCAHTLDKGSLGLLFLAAEKADIPDFFRNPDTLDHIWSKSRRTLRVVSGLQKTRALEIFSNYQKKH